MNDQLVLAVDGGATKTTMTVRTSNGTCLFEGTTSASNYQAIGAKKVEETLTSLLKLAYESTNLKTIHAAVFAMAGIDTAHDLMVVQEIIHRSIANSPFAIEQLIIENDVHSTLIGLIGVNKPGVLLISGTGAIGVASNGLGTVVRTGGWGHRAGDEGSGYWIGKKIINAIFRMEDGRDESPTVLRSLVFKKLNMTNLEQLMNWLYSPNFTNEQLASISTVLSEAVQLKDDKARFIAQKAAEELSILAQATLSKISTDEPLTLFLNGGVFKYNDYITRQFKELTLPHYPNITIELCQEYPIEYIAKRAFHSIYENKPRN